MEFTNFHCSNNFHFFFIFLDKVEKLKSMPTHFYSLILLSVAGVKCILKYLFIAYKAKYIVPDKLNEYIYALFQFVS